MFDATGRRLVFTANLRARIAEAGAAAARSTHRRRVTVRRRGLIRVRAVARAGLALSDRYRGSRRIVNPRPTPAPAAGRSVGRLGNHRNANESNQAEYEPFHRETLSFKEPRPRLHTADRRSDKQQTTHGARRRVLILAANLRAGVTEATRLRPAIRPVAPRWLIHSRLIRVRPVTGCRLRLCRRPGRSRSIRCWRAALASAAGRLSRADANQCQTSHRRHNNQEFLHRGTLLINGPFGSPPTQVANRRSRRGWNQSRARLD